MRFSPVGRDLCLNYAPPSVALEDDGLFIMTGYLNGIAHPPGYPLYTTLNYVFTHLPVGSVAFRAHMLSAVFAAATCTMLWVLCFRVLRSRVLAYTSALGYGLSASFWSQAIIAEVYTLEHLLLFFVAVLVLPRFTVTRQPRSSPSPHWYGIGVWVESGKSLAVDGLGNP